MRAFGELLLRRCGLMAGVLLVAGCPGEQVTGTPTEEPATETDTDVEPDDEPGVPTFLANFPAACSSARVIGPAAGESNHLAGTVLDPGVWPYRVDVLQIVVSNEPQDELTCDADLEQTAYLWIMDGASFSPPSDAVPERTVTFPALDVGDDPARNLEVALDPPIVLNEGEKLVVGYQFAGTFPDSTCIAACRTGFTTDVDYWSNAATQPYAWSLLEDFGITSNLWIFVEGDLVE